LIVAGSFGGAGWTSACGLSSLARHPPPSLCVAGRVIPFLATELTLRRGRRYVSVYSRGRSAGKPRVGVAPLDG